MELTLDSYTKSRGDEIHVTRRRRIAAELCEQLEMSKEKLQNLSSLMDELINVDEAQFETMGRMAQNILVKNYKGGSNLLRQDIKRIESSTWYFSNKNTKAKTASPYCKDSDSPSHDKDECFGLCPHCGKRGIKAQNCHKKGRDAKKEKVKKAEEEKK